jgi:hypothetical protein
MNNDQERLLRIFNKTDGRCHLSGRRLSFKNYGKAGRRGAWEVDHSRAQTNGGSHHLNNLYPASITANRSKQARSTRSARGDWGQTRAPLSKAAQERKSEANGWKFMAAGALLGLRFGPVGALFGGVAGLAFGLNAPVE